MILIEENGKDSHFKTDLGPLGPDLGLQFSFIKLVVKHCSKQSRLGLLGGDLIQGGGEIKNKTKSGNI